MCCYSYSSNDSVPADRRHHRPKGGFPMNHARLYCRRLRVRLLKLVRFLIRRFESVQKRLTGGTCAGVGGSSSRRRCSRSSSGRSLVPFEDCHGYSSSSSYKTSRYAQSPFYAEAIADCLEFIKRSSGHVTMMED